MKTIEIKLTRKQKQAVELLACDFTVPEMAVFLHTFQQTIYDRVERAKARLGVKHQGGLVAEAIRYNCINVHLLKKKKR